MKPSARKARTNSLLDFSPKFFVRRISSLPKSTIFCGFSIRDSFLRWLFKAFLVRFESSFLSGGHESKFSFLSFTRRQICRALSLVILNSFAISANEAPFTLRTYILSSRAANSICSIILLKSSLNPHNRQFAVRGGERPHHCRAIKTDTSALFATSLLMLPMRRLCDLVPREPIIIISAPS